MLQATCSGFTQAACRWLGVPDPALEHTLLACRSIPACAGSTQAEVTHSPQAVGPQPYCGI